MDRIIEKICLGTMQSAQMQAHTLASAHCSRRCSRWERAVAGQAGTRAWLPIRLIVRKSPGEVKGDRVVSSRESPISFVRHYLTLKRTLLHHVPSSPRTSTNLGAELAPKDITIPMQVLLMPSVPTISIPS